MKFAFFESLKTGVHFFYHFEEYVKINDREAQKVNDKCIKLFTSNTVTFPVA
jgi:hypothetical protein